MVRKHSSHRWPLWSLLGLALVAHTAFAADVRGRIIFQDGAPFAGAKVRICPTPQTCTPIAISGIDGMYYVYGVPAGGPYNLEVYVDSEQPRTVIQVVVTEDWTDAPQITL